MPKRRNTAIRAATATAALAGLFGCSNDHSITAAVATPTPASAPSVVATLRGTVDAAGNVTFQAISPSSSRMANGVNAMVYGSQNINVRLYATPMVIDSVSTPGTKTWSFRLGVRNYLPYPIGSNQAGPTPSDTMGVFVAVINGPTIVTTSRSCSSCGMSLANPDGVANFTGPNQKYFYWHERLAAKQAVAGADTTSTRRLWRFSGPSAITGFSFEMVVSAAWPPPAELAWSVFYNAATDSLPDTQAEPAWTPAKAYGGGTESWVPGLLTFQAGSNEDIYRRRADSLSSTSQAYMEVSANLGGSISRFAKNTPIAVFGIGNDHMPLIGIAQTQVGFVQFNGGEWQFIGSTYSFPTKGSSQTSGLESHVYRVRKFGSDSARLELDGNRVLKISGSQFPTNPGGANSPITTLFGMVGQGSSVNASFGYVTYGIGVNQP